MVSSPCDGWVHWQGSKCKSKCFAAFSLRTKSLRPGPNAAPLMCRTKLNKVRLRSDFGATVDSDGVLVSHLIIRKACVKQFSIRKYAF